MGCGASKAPPPTTLEPVAPLEATKDPSKEPAKEPVIKDTEAEKKLNSRRSKMRMSVMSETAALNIFTKAAAASQPGATGAGQATPEGLKEDEMTFEGLKSALKDVDEALLGFLFRLFDADGSGKVDTHEFLVTLGLMKTCTTPEEQLEACFVMFDTTNSGTLTRAEFETMIQASVNLNLTYLLQTEGGKQAFEDQLSKEFSQENLEFYEAAKAFRDLPEEDRLANAKKLMQKYVKDGADEQINLPSAMVKKLEKAFKELKASGGIPDAEMFALAEKEILSLMEKDTHKRWDGWGWGAGARPGRWKAAHAPRPSPLHFTPHHTTP